MMLWIGILVIIFVICSTIWIFVKQHKRKKKIYKLKLQLNEELENMSLTEIEDKIQKWKEKGYTVDEIDKMIYEYKILR